MRRLIGIIVCILATMPLAVSAQNLPPVTPSEVTGDIAISGSDALVPLTQQITTRFSLDGYTGNITVTPGNTEDAIAALCNGTLDIALAGRQITPQEVNTCQSTQVSPIGLRVATDALVVTVSTENGFITGVTTNELAPLFSTAASWSDVRADFPAQPIQRYSPAETTSIYQFFVDSVLGGEARALRTAFNVTFSDDLNTLATNVQQNRLATGYFSAAFLNSENINLRRLTIDNISPTQETIVNSTYPLARPLFLYTSESVFQAKPQVADFVNYYLTNATNEASTLGVYPAGAQNLNAAINRWFSAAGQVAPAPAATEPAAQPTPTQVAVGTQPTTIDPVTPTPDAPAAAFQAGVLPLLVEAREDLETAATERFGDERPEGWNGNLDIDNPQLPLLIRVDLEILAAVQYGQDNRPDNWFGAVGSTQLAIAQDIRHDLDILGIDLYGSQNALPASWADADPLLRCDRSTRSLASLLQSTDAIDLQIDSNAPDYCAQVEQTVSRFTEVNLLQNPDAISFNSGSGGGIGSFRSGGNVRIPGNVIIDSEFGVGFYDRFARQKAGTIPLETPIEPIARSYTQFSNMTLVRGANFVLFVDWLDTSLTAEQFLSLPNVNDAGVETQCSARWC